MVSRHQSLINHHSKCPLSRTHSLGQNLQICFMNEAASDSESSDSETCPKLSQGIQRRKAVQRTSLMSHRTTALNNNPYSSRPLSIAKSVMDRTERGEFLPSSHAESDWWSEHFLSGNFPFPFLSRSMQLNKIVAERPATLALNVNDASDNNFFTHQARLQIEARMALAQAKDIAHMQIEVLIQN